MSDERKKDFWDKAQVMSAIIGAIAVPVVLLIVGQILARSNIEREEAAQSV